MSSLSQRNFQALLLGLIKLRFYGEEDIKAQDVQNQIFEDSDLDPAGIDDLISLCDELLLETAKKNWDASHLAQRLQQTRLTEEDVRVFEKVWGKESARIHKVLVDNSQWNTSLEKLLWRIDLQSNTGSDRSPTSTKSKSNNSSNENSNTDQDNINTGIAEPTVIVQMNLRNKRSNGLDVVHFEMDSEQINRIVKEIEGIEGVVSRIV